MWAEVGDTGRRVQSPSQWSHRTRFSAERDSAWELSVRERLAQGFYWGLVT